MSKKIVSDFYAVDSYEMPKCSNDKHAVLFALGDSVEVEKRLKLINNHKNFKTKNDIIYIKPHKEITLDFRLWAGLPKGYIMTLDVVPLHNYKDLVITSKRVLQGEEDWQTKILVKIYNMSSKTIKINTLVPTLIGKYYKCSTKPLKIGNISASSGGYFEAFKSRVKEDNSHLLKVKDVNIKSNN